MGDTKILEDGEISNDLTSSTAIPTYLSSIYSSADYHALRILVLSKTNKPGY